MESVDSLNRDDLGTSLTQYITNASISQAWYTFKHFKHDHRYLRLISYPISVITMQYNCNYILNHMMSISQFVHLSSFFSRANAALS